jgi:hypothetical protein
VPSGRSTERGESRRYGDGVSVANAVVALIVLMLIAGWTVVDSAHFMSNACFEGNSQIVCPIDGPDWVRPLPGSAAAMGVLTALAGVVAGRPFRRPALIVGYGLTVAGLVVSRLAG